MYAYARCLSSTPATNPQDHPSHHPSSRQSSMRLGGLTQRIARLDRHAESGPDEVTIQLLEFPRIRDRIEGTQPKRRPCHWDRLDSVRMCDTSLRPYEVETPLELLSAGECQHTIEALGREPSELIDRLWPPSIDHVLRAEPSDETSGRGTGCSGDDMGTTLNRELNRHRADGS